MICTKIYVYRYIWLAMHLSELYNKIEPAPKTYTHQTKKCESRHPARLTAQTGKKKETSQSRIESLSLN